MDLQVIQSKIYNIRGYKVMLDFDLAELYQVETKFLKSEQKIFHCEIVVDNEKVKQEAANYKKLPPITNFQDEDENDRMQETIQANYIRIKEDIQQIVLDELKRIKKDPKLKHLIKEKEC